MKRVFKIFLALVLSMLLMTGLRIDVDAKQEHKHCICGDESGCEETGHTDKTFEKPWTAPGPDISTEVGECYRFETSETYFLDEDVSLDMPFVVEGGCNIAICLNGHSFSAPSIYVADGNTLIFSDCAPGDAKNYFTYSTTDAWTLTTASENSVEIAKISEETKDGAVVHANGGALVVKNGILTAGKFYAYSITMAGCEDTLVKTKKYDIFDGGSCEIYQCSICGNKVDGTDGKLLEADANGRISLKNTEIIYNIAQTAVYSDDFNTKIEIFNALIANNSGDGLNINNDAELFYLQVKNNQGTGIISNPNATDEHASTTIGGYLNIDGNGKDFTLSSKLELDSETPLAKGSKISLSIENTNILPLTILGLEEKDNEILNMFSVNPLLYSLKFGLDEEEDPVLLVTGISEQPSEENDYQVTAIAEELDGAEIGYQWQERSLQYDYVKDIDDFLYNTEETAFHYDSTKHEVSRLPDNDEIDTESREGCGIISLKFTASEEIELSKDNGTLEKDGDYYIFTFENFGFAVKSKSGNAFTLGDFQIGTYKYEDVSGQTNKQLTGESGRYYRCAVTVNGVKEYSDAVKVGVVGSVSISNEDSGSAVDNKEALDKILAAYKKNFTSGNVVVSLKITKDEVATSEKALVEAELGSQQAVYYNVNLYVINGSEETNIGGENTELISVTYDFDFANKKDVKVLRVHDGAVSTLTTTPNAKGEKIVLDTENKKVTIIACQYSTYAIAYSPDVPDTGDANQLWLYMLLAGLAVISMAVLFATKKNNR